MQNFDIVKETEATGTFRAQSVVGKYDLKSLKVTERFKGLIELPDTWQIGLIVGSSGTGKTTILKELFGDYIVENLEFKSTAVVDDMPENASMAEICETFNSVGFSSPPSWLKPYYVLSNGEKMRVQLAKALLLESQIFAFDEFTSVVDRNVAKIGSHAMQKAIRRSKKKFIACTCHYDVEEWLLPDWVFSTDDMLIKKKRRGKDHQSVSKYTRQERTKKNYGEFLHATTI